MTAQEINIKLNRFKQILAPLEGDYVSAVLDENWQVAATIHNRISQVNHARSKMLLEIEHIDVVEVEHVPEAA